MRLALAVCTFLLLASPPALAQEIEVVFFDVGQGDATLLISPTGRTMLIDGGLENRGLNDLVPWLNGRDIDRLDWVCATHYHTDHIGGLDEIHRSGIQIGEVLDRGDVDLPSSSAVANYQATFAGMRRTVLPGEVLDLGGGLTATCLSVNGKLANGATVDISGTAQQENSASIAWRVEFGDFDMFLGGDLTGGSRNSVSVERPVSWICGDVDVYRVNLHGSSISSTAPFLRRLLPELAIVSVASPNPYNYPRPDAISRLNKVGRAIPVWSTSAGNGGPGYVDCGGTIRLTSDGTSYRAIRADGSGFRAWCDEVETVPPAPGTVVVSEFHRNPDAVSDFYGEWIEITGVLRDAQLGLRGLEVQTGNGQSFTLATNFALDQATELLFAADGIPLRNGGAHPVLAWPAGAVALDDVAGEIVLESELGHVLDSVHYQQGWPGGKGVACERIDLLAPAELANFVGAGTPFGDGDLGTPSHTNAGDLTDWYPGGDAWVRLVHAARLGHDFDVELVFPGQTGMRYQAGLSYGTSPGTSYRGTLLPINSDNLWGHTTREPGWKGYVPGGDVVGLRTSVPGDPALSGMVVYAFGVAIDAHGDLTSWTQPVPMLLLD